LTKNLKLAILLSITVLLLRPAAFAENNAATILRLVEEKNATTTSVSRTGMFVYPDAGANEYRSYEMIGYSQGDDDSYMSFVAPRSIRGMSILSKGDDLWIFFPSTGRVRKIAGRAKDQSIQGVGGDFSYEDMSAGKLSERYDFTITDDSDEYWLLEGNAEEGIRLFQGHHDD